MKRITIISSIIVVLLASFLILYFYKNKSVNYEASDMSEQSTKINSIEIYLDSYEGKGTNIINLIQKTQYPLFILNNKSAKFVDFEEKEIFFVSDLNMKEAFIQNYLKTIDLESLNNSRFFTDGSLKTYKVIVVTDSSSIQFFVDEEFVNSSNEPFALFYRDLLSRISKNKKVLNTDYIDVNTLRRFSPEELTESERLSAFTFESFDPSKVQQKVKDTGYSVQNSKLPVIYIRSENYFYAVIYVPEL